VLLLLLWLCARRNLNTLQHAFFDQFGSLLGLSRHAM
jgi:hypothetical protein